MVDFQGAENSADPGLVLVREEDESLSIIDRPMRACRKDLKSPQYLVHLLRHRVNPIAAGYEDCQETDFLRIDPALRLALDKDHKAGASLCRALSSELLMPGGAGRTSGDCLSSWIPPRL
jgi:hypothetical protein